jgi:hypothetical protein
MMKTYKSNQISFGLCKPKYHCKNSEIMEETSDDSNDESKLEDNIQRLLEQNRINTQALRKLLNFMEGKTSAEDTPSTKSQDEVIDELKN